MYTGESTTAVDEKGRINIPVHLKSRMDASKHETWHVTRGYDGALFFFPDERWNEVVKMLETPNGLHPRLYNFRRFILGSEAVVKMDKQNRFNLPQTLLDYAGIERNAVILGLGDHLEVWSARGWKAFQECQMDSFKRAAEELFGCPRSVVGLPTEGAEG